ncbi:type II secretion system F family protein [Gudongella sp. DL1XJH-153]|uniref:type II secretion system F family protein n=1 Tax=Gudongella sp. DL1XJH-153 TaxID=3409804 RepID=UPI003BB73E25
MMILAYLSTIAFVAYLVLIVYGVVFQRKEKVKGRLESLKQDFVDPTDESVLQEPFKDRIIKPAYQKFIGFLGRTTPKGISKAMERTIIQAGSPGNINVNRLIAIQFMVAIILPAFYFLVVQATASELNPLMIVFLALVGFILPYYILNIKARARRSRIQKSLPDMLDLIFVSVEAGLGFDMALKRTTEKMPGPLSDEINRALDEINKGRKREDALRGIYARTGVDDISSFMTAVIQSEQLGSNIANMLRVQSTSMRQKRRQRAEEAAMKVPVKMLFPLVVFMFPALFIVILGPAIIRIIRVFSDMI